MNGKEALAIMAISIAVPAGLGAEIAAHEQQTARAAAITAEACHEAYDGNGPNPVIHERTLECMRGGWIPHGRTLSTWESTVELKRGWPIELLDGYVKIQEGRADSFNTSAPLIGGLVGVGIGVFALGMLTKDEEKSREEEETEPDGPELEDDPKDSVDLSKS